MARGVGRGCRLLVGWTVVRFDRGGRDQGDEVMRRTMIVGNWKMNGLVETAMELADSIRKGMNKREERNVVCEVVICPPFTALHPVNAIIGNSSIKLGGQNMAVEEGGAHTGEVCGIMLRNVGCRYVILGHSERRRLDRETDEQIAAKVSAALRDGLQPIVCVGETAEERESGVTLEVVKRQIEVVLAALQATTAKPQALVVAYEPVWAIGTGKNATPEQIQEVHKFIRGLLAERLGESPARKIRLLYGGSLGSANAQGIFALADVDGGLVGGASLNPQEFLAIIDSIP